MIHADYALAAVALFAVETGIALFVHDAVVRPLAGDALVVVLVYCALRAVTPLPVRWGVATAFGIACAVEIGQAAGLVDRLGLGGNAVARIVLGTNYDPRDFAAYALGALAAAAVEYVRRRGADPSRAT